MLFHAAIVTPASIRRKDKVPTFSAKRRMSASALRQKGAGVDCSHACARRHSLAPSPHSFPSSVSDITSATIPRLTRQRQGARLGPTPIVTLLFASELSAPSTTAFGLFV